MRSGNPMDILSQRRPEGQEMVSGHAAGLLMVIIKNLIKTPWTVWLSWLERCPTTKRLQV